MAMNAILALFLMARFDFTERSIGWVYTGVGSISLLMRSLILGRAVRRFGELGVMRLGLGSLALSFLLQPLAPSLVAYAVVIVLIPIGTALLFPATSSLVSRFASRSDLGEVMGVQQAYGGLARLFGPLWAGAAFQTLGPGSPFFIAAALAVATFAFVAGLETPPARRTEPAPAGEPGATATR